MMTTDHVKRFLITLSLGIFFIVLSESFCVLDSTYVRITKDGRCTWGTYRVETDGVDTLEYRAEDPGKPEGTVPFWSDEEIARKVCTISVPKDIPLQWRFLNGLCQCSTRHTGNNLIYTFVVENLQKFDVEPNMADIEIVAPKLEIALKFDEPEVSEKENNRLVIEAKDFLDEDGNIFGSITLTAQGKPADYLTAVFTGNPKAEWKSIFESFMLGVSPKAKLLGIDYGRDPLKSKDKSVSISIKYSIREYAVMGDNILSFKPVTLNNFIPALFSFVKMDTSVEKRKYKFKDDYSREISISEHINIPRGYLLSTGSQRSAADGKTTTFKGCVSQSYAGLDIVENVTLTKNIYEPDEWPEFRNTVEEFRKYADWITIVK